MRGREAHCCAVEAAQGRVLGHALGERLRLRRILLRMHSRLKAIPSHETKPCMSQSSLQLIPPITTSALHEPPVAVPPITVFALHELPVPALDAINHIQPQPGRARHDEVRHTRAEALLP